MIPRRKKMNRYEKRALQQEQVQRALEGKGMYVFENISRGSLILSKPSVDVGRGPIPPGGRWKGDSYFHQLVKDHDAKIVEIITSPQETNMANKLLVDQPDRITAKGTVEQIIPSQPLNEVDEFTPNAEVLLTEDPLAGVEILMD